MKRHRTGQLITVPTPGESFQAFVPDPLPPVPALGINESLRGELDQALLALGRLDSLTTLLPDTSLFLYMYVRKEAVLSSQIEDTQSSLSDLLLYENDAVPGVPLDDVREVSSYVAAMEHGLKRIRGGLAFNRPLHRRREPHHQVLFRLPGESCAAACFSGASACLRRRMRQELVQSEKGLDKNDACRFFRNAVHIEAKQE